MAKPDYLKEIDDGLRALRTEHGADVEGNVAFRAAQAVGGAADVIDPVKLEAERQRQRQLKGPAQKTARYSAKASRGELQKLNKAGHRAKIAVKGADDLDPAYAAEVLQGVKETQQKLAKKPPQAAVDRYQKYAGKGLVGTVFGVLDAPDRQIRHLTLPTKEGAPEPPLVTSLTGDKSSDVTSQEWNDRIVERVGKFERPGDVVSNVVGRIGQGIGEAIGTPLSGLPITLGVAADLAEGKGLSGLTPENVQKTREQTVRDVGDFARSAIFSPLNLVGGFQSGGLKVAEQVVDIGKKIGISDDVLRAAAKQYLAEFGASPGPRESLEAGIKYAESVLGPDVAKKAFGAKFEFLGKEGLKLAGREVGGVAGTQKAVKKVADTLGVAPDLFDPAKDIARVSIKRAKVARAAAEQKGQKEWADVAKVAAHEGVTPSRLDDLIQPGATPGEIALGKAASPSEKLVVEGAQDVLSRQPTIRPGKLPADIEAPVGALSTKRGFDAAMLGNAREQARTVGERFLQEDLARQFGGSIPPVAQKILDATERAGELSSMSRALGKFFGPDHAATKIAAWWERQANAMKRGVLMRRPGYFTLNVWDDGLRMFGAGVNNPIKYLNRADGLMKAAQKGDGAAAKILSEAQAEGIAVDALDRAEYMGAQGGQALRRTAAGKDPRTIGQRIPDVVPLSDNFAARWENTSKLAMYLWGRERGMPAWAAAKSALDTLIDYGDRGRALNVARWFTPFITWAAKAPKIAATQIAQRPARIANIGRAVNQVSGDEFNEPRSYIGDQGMVKSLPGPMARLYSAGREAVGGEPLSPGETIGFRPRLGHEDAFQLPKAFGGAVLGTLQGKPWQQNLRPLVSQLGPGWKAAFEAVSGTDVTTGQPVQLKPTGLIPSEVAPPWVPEQLVTTGKEEHGYIPRHFVNYLPGVREIGPAAPLAANIAMHELAGKPAGQQPPVSYYGFNRPFAYDTNPKDLYYNLALNFLTGVPLVSTLPEGATWSAAHSPEVQGAIKKVQFQRKKAKEGFKNR